jgi:phosphoglycolate phosphatase-like HAD superfamily hydrolase
MMTRRNVAAICLMASLLFLIPACTSGSSSDSPSPAAEGQAAALANPLPSWNDGEVKSSIVAFVESVTNAASPNYVPAPERVAVFDNDGTLWSEQPIYFQFFFALDRIRAMAPEHPEWQDQQPFKAILESDFDTVMAGGRHAIEEILLTSHSGMTTAEFEQLVSEWIATARHPTTERLFTQMVYQPMLELLAYLRANDFKTYIVSGGGIEFMRPWVQEAYGILPEEVVGSSFKVEFEMRDDGPVLMHLDEINFVNDKAGKPVGISRFIGRRPIFAFGNSDGDLQMLQWTAGRDGASFMGIVHHTDAEREWAYDRESHIGHLDEALNEASEHGWTIVDMKRDWAAIYPPER